MRFDSIDISNYRQYRSLHVDFEKTKDTDLHIIVASNGVGKTNLLNAINWCLYGDEPHLADEDDSLLICNNTALEEARQNNKETVEVSVKIKTTSVDGNIIFERTQSINTATKFEDPNKFKVTIIKDDGNSDIREGEAAKDITNHFLPQKIRQYFFFDGEQLHNYFSKGQGSTHVKDSIHEIAQINVVTKVKEHLNVMISEYRKSLANLNPQVDALNAELTDKEQTRNNLKDQIEELKTSIRQSEDKIEELNLLISGTESVVDDNNKYNSNVKEIEDCERVINESNDKLRKLLRQYFVLVMMYDLNKSTNDYIQEKYDRGALPPDIDLQLVSQSLKSHECALCHQHTDEEAEAYLNEIINKYEVSNAVSHKLTEIKNDVSRSCRDAEKYMEEKKKIFDQKRDAENKKKDLTSENEELYKRISSCSSVEQIGLWMSEREDHRNLIKTNTEKKGSYKAQVEALENEIEALNKKIKLAVADNEKSEAIGEQLAFASEACAIVTSIEEEIVCDIRNKMETETMSLFESLIWKKNTYGRIELNDEYKLRLFHKVTNESCLGSCSAAERELLALAFTIALHRVSNHDCLLFIDTPVGRVSDVNRENFAKSLITVSKQKQLILAFTPSEYSDEVKKYFNSSVISSSNKLINLDEEATQKEALS